MFFSPPVTHDVKLLRASKTLNRSGSTYPKDLGRELLRISCLHCISGADIRTAPPWGEFWRSRSAHFDNLSGQIINRIAFSNSQHQDLPIVFILVGLWQFDTGWPLKHLARPQTLSMQIARLWGGHWDQHYLIYMLGTIHMHTNIRTNQIDTLHTFNVLVSKGCKYSTKIFSQQNRVNWYLVYFVFRMFHLTFGINIFYIKHISHGVFGIGNFLWFLSLSSGTFPLSAFVKITKETLLAEAVSF